MPLNGIGELIEHTRKQNKAIKSRRKLAELSGESVSSIRWLERAATYFPGEKAWKIVDALGIPRKIIQSMLEGKVKQDPRDILRNGVKK